MPQTLLIDETVIQQYRTISSSVNEAKRITPFVYEAQIFDLKPLLGAPLYDDFVKNNTDAKYLELLNGAEYIDPQGYLCNFDGLKAALSYWAYARFLENQQITVTSHSVVTKDNPYSTPIDSKTIMQRVAHARSGGLAYYEQAEKFLYDKNFEDPNNYPLWLKSIRKKPKTSGMRITKIDAFNRQYSTRPRTRLSGYDPNYLIDEFGNIIDTENNNNFIV